MSTKTDFGTQLVGRSSL